MTNDKSLGRCSSDCNPNSYVVRKIFCPERAAPKEKRDAVIALAARHGARQPRIFGSEARSEAGPESDIDLLVKMEEGRSLLDLSALVQDLQDLLGIKVDLVSEDGLYWLLRRRILKEAIPL